MGSLVELGGVVRDLADTAFMDVFAGGMYTGVGFLVAGAIVLIKRRMRTQESPASLDGGDVGRGQ